MKKNRDKSRLLFAVIAMAMGRKIKLKDIKKIVTFLKKNASFAQE